RDLTSHSSRRRRAPAELAAAAATLTALDRRLIATPAPPEATKLRALLIKLVAQQAALTREVHDLAVFTPRFSVYVTRLRHISAHFDTAMRNVPAPKLKPVRGTRAKVAAAERAFHAQQDAAAAAQAGAIDTYLGALTGLLKGLDTLHPPAVVAPAFAAEMQSLHDVTVTGAQLSATLRTSKRLHLGERI